MGVVGRTLPENPGKADLDERRRPAFCKVRRSNWTKNKHPLGTPPAMKVGDIFLAKYPAVTVKHTIVGLQPNRVRLKAAGNGFLFWLSREVVEKHWPKPTRP